MEQFWLEYLEDVSKRVENMDLTPQIEETMAMLDINVQGDNSTKLNAIKLKDRNAYNEIIEEFEKNKQILLDDYNTCITEQENLLGKVQADFDIALKLEEKYKQYIENEKQTLEQKYGFSVDNFSKVLDTLNSKILDMQEKISNEKDPLKRDSLEEQLKTLSRERDDFSEHLQKYGTNLVTRENLEKTYNEEKERSIQIADKAKTSIDSLGISVNGINLTDLKTKDEIENEQTKEETSQDEQTQDEQTQEEVGQEVPKQDEQAEEEINQEASKQDEQAQGTPNKEVQAQEETSQETPKQDEQTQGVTGQGTPEQDTQTQDEKDQEAPTTEEQELENEILPTVKIDYTKIAESLNVITNINKLPLEKISIEDMQKYEEAVTLINASKEKIDGKKMVVDKKTGAYRPALGIRDFFKKKSVANDIISESASKLITGNKTPVSEILGNKNISFEEVVSTNESPARSKEKYAAESIKRLILTDMLGGIDSKTEKHLTEEKNNLIASGTSDDISDRERISRTAMFCKKMTGISRGSTELKKFPFDSERLSQLCDGFVSDPNAEIENFIKEALNEQNKKTQQEVVQEIGDSSRDKQSEEHQMEQEAR